MSAGGMRIVQMIPAPEHTYRVKGVTPEDIAACGIGGVTTYIESVAMFVALIERDYCTSEIRAVTLAELANRALAALNGEPTPYALAGSVEEAQEVARAKLCGYIAWLARHEDEAVRAWVAAHDLIPTPVPDEELLLELRHTPGCRGCADGVAEP